MKWSYSMIAYILLCIVIGLTTFTQLNKSGRTWTAILSLILFILIFVFYGLRWFDTSGPSAYKGVWPPLINMCPDYLVFFRNGNRETCVDMLGVSRTGALKPWGPEDNSSNPPADENKYFPYVYKPGLPEERLRVLCQKTQEAGLTWEGITNGDSCTYTPAEKVKTT
jgi:hypothetical protein